MATLLDDFVHVMVKFTDSTTARKWYFGNLRTTEIGVSCKKIKF